MFLCIRQFKFPSNQSYLPLKCMSLQTQSYPNILQSKEPSPPVQYENSRTWLPRNANENAVYEPFVKHGVLPYNHIAKVKLIENLEEPLLLQSRCSSPVLCTDLPHQCNFSILDELGNSSGHSRSVICHSVMVLPELVGNSQHLAHFLDGCGKSPCIKTPLTSISCSSVEHSSGNQPEKRKKTDGRPSEEHLIRIKENLSHYLPRFFTVRHDYSLYHKDLVFHNNISGVTTRGLFAYVRHLSMIRVLLQLKYTNVQVHILKVTHHPEDGTIRLRWRISGVPGLKVLFMFWKFRFSTAKDNREAEWIDGFSIFHVGSDGYIYKHVCDKMMPDENIEKVKTGPLAMKFAGVLGFLSSNYGLAWPSCY